MFYDFIWGKSDKVKRDVLINDIHNGGLKMIDIESMFYAVKASWAVRLQNADECDLWTMVARYHLKYNDDLMFLFRLNCTSKTSLSLFKKLPSFYQEVVTSFNMAKCINKEVFLNTILDQPIWGNDFIKCIVNGKEKPMVFKSWMNCKLMKIRNLKFIDGVLDDTFIFNTVSNHINVMSEISSLRKALKPYREYIGNHEADTGSDLPLFQHVTYSCEEFASPKSKPFYDWLVEKKASCPLTQENYWLDTLNVNDVEFKYVYKVNLQDVYDKKIAEFNFKVLHCILACNVNLVRWRKRECKLCVLCRVDENIEHLLFNCSFAKDIWNDLSRILDISIELQDIVLNVRYGREVRFIVSLTAYLIYKQWLLQSIEDIPRPRKGSLKLLKRDLAYRHSIYKQIKWFNVICNILDVIICAI